MEMANTNCKDLREVFRSWTHSKSMLGVCILHDLLLFFGRVLVRYDINCSLWTRLRVTVMSEGVLIAIRTLIPMYVERPICMDVICFGKHAAYNAHKKHKLARANEIKLPYYRPIVPFIVLDTDRVAPRPSSSLNLVLRGFILRRRATFPDLEYTCG